MSDIMEFTDPPPFDARTLEIGSVYASADKRKWTVFGRYEQTEPYPQVWLAVCSGEHRKIIGTDFAWEGDEAFPAGPWVEPPKPREVEKILVAYTFRDELCVSQRRIEEAIPQGALHARRIKYTEGGDFEFGEVIKQ